MRIISDKKYEEFEERLYEIESLKADLREKDVKIRRLEDKKEVVTGKKLAVGNEKKIHFVKVEFETHYLVNVFVEGFGWTTELVEKGDDVIELKEVQND